MTAVAGSPPPRSSQLNTSFAARDVTCHCGGGDAPQLKLRRRMRFSSVQCESAFTKQQNAQNNVKNEAFKLRLKSGGVVG